MKKIRQPNFALDSTLRYLYNTLRNTKSLLMAVEFEYRGKKYRVDTVQEAVELSHELEKHDALHVHYGSTPTQRVWTADVAMDLLNGIGELQHKLLRNIPFTPNGISSETLTERMGLESELVLAGIVSGLSKQLRKMSISPSDLYRVSVQWQGKNKKRYFELLPEFRDAANELGWPDAWEQKAKRKE